jgi:O-antigen ligase
MPPKLDDFLRYVPLGCFGAICLLNPFLYKGIPFISLLILALWGGRHVILKSWRRVIQAWALYILAFSALLLIQLSYHYLPISVTALLKICFFSFVALIMGLTPEKVWTENCVLPSRALYAFFWLGLGIMYMEFFSGHVIHHFLAHTTELHPLADSFSKAPLVFFVALYFPLCQWGKSNMNVFKDVLLFIILTTLLIGGRFWSGFLGLVFGTCCYGLSFWWPRLINWSLYGVISASLWGTPILIEILSSYNINEYIGNLFPTLAERITHWGEVLSLVWERPLLGWGLGQGKGLGFAMVGDQSLWHPHNIILQLWLDMGVGGVFLVQLILLFMFLQLRHVRFVCQSRHAIFMGVIGAFFLMSLVSYDLWQTWSWSVFFLSLFYTKALWVKKTQQI